MSRVFLSSFFLTSYLFVSFSKSECVIRERKTNDAHFLFFCFSRSNSHFSSRLVIEPYASVLTPFFLIPVIFFLSSSSSSFISVDYFSVSKTVSWEEHVLMTILLKNTRRRENKKKQICISNCYIAEVRRDSNLSCSLFGLHTIRISDE